MGLQLGSLSTRGSGTDAGPPRGSLPAASAPLR